MFYLIELFKGLPHVSFLMTQVIGECPWQALHSRYGHSFSLNDRIEGNMIASHQGNVDRSTLCIGVVLPLYSIRAI